MLEGCTFCITTFGCQMNKHDSERISGMLQDCGMAPVDTHEEADISVFVTCCVREKADERLYGQVASMKNLAVRPHAQLAKRCICIGGCIGQRDGEKLLQSLEHVDVVFGTHNIDALPQLIEESIEEGSRMARIEDGRDVFINNLPESREHAWAAWLPISVGCNNFCTYCIVPYVRGREISLAFESIEQQAADYVNAGVKEITLLGQNVNSYGRDLYGRPRFADVLDAVSATGVERIRFATSHPKDISDEVIERFATLDNLMPALHLPVQSGSDSILAAMNRNYTAARYTEIVNKLRAARPDIALSTDIIVGFPGETDQDFKQTCELIKSIGFTQVFTFIYSKREGTPAANMPDNTPREIIAERFERLRSIVEDGAIAANKRYEGQVQPVLFESFDEARNVLSGKTPHGVTAHVDAQALDNPAQFVGNTASVQIDLSRTWYLKGSLVSL